MRNFSDYYTAFAVRRFGEGDFYEAWLLKDKEGVWLKKLTGNGIGQFSPLIGQLSDYIGYSEKEYKQILSQEKHNGFYAECLNNAFDYYSALPYPTYK